MKKYRVRLNPEYVGYTNTQIKCLMGIRVIRDWTVTPLTPALFGALKEKTVIYRFPDTKIETVVDIVEIEEIVEKKPKPKATPKKPNDVTAFTGRGQR